jgi:hypothetical protein
MPEDPDQLLTSHEVAAIFRVSERTVRRWHETGQLDDCAIYTPGGHLRYRAATVRARATPPQTSAPGVPLTTPAPGADPGQETSRGR